MMAIFVCVPLRCLAVKTKTSLDMWWEKREIKRMLWNYCIHWMPVFCKHFFLVSEKGWLFAFVEVKVHLHSNVWIHVISAISKGLFSHDLPFEHWNIWTWNESSYHDSLDTLVTVQWTLIMVVVNYFETFFAKIFKIHLDLGKTEFQWKSLIFLEQETLKINSFSGSRFYIVNSYCHHKFACDIQLLSTTHQFYNLVILTQIWQCHIW